MSRARPVCCCPPACLPMEGRADRGWMVKHTIVDPIQLELLVDALLLLLLISRTINHLHGGCWDDGDVVVYYEKDATRIGPGAGEIMYSGSKG